MRLYGLDYILVGIASFIGGVYYSKKFYKEKYQKEKEDEISDVKASYEEYFSSKNKENKEAGEKEADEAIFGKVKDPFTSASSLFADDDEAASYVKDHIDYSSKGDSLAEAEHPRDSDEDDDDDDYPYEISIDDYMETNGHAKICISYYAGSKVFVREERDEEETEFVQDPHNLFGYVLEKTGWLYSEGPKPAYIRNNSIGTDYEIVWYAAEYDW